MKLRSLLEKYLLSMRSILASIGHSGNEKRISGKRKLKENYNATTLLLTQMLKSISAATIATTLIILLWSQSLFVIVWWISDSFLTTVLNTFEKLNSWLIRKLQKTLQ